LPTLTFSAESTNHRSEVEVEDLAFDFSLVFASYKVFVKYELVKTTTKGPNIYFD